MKIAVFDTDLTDAQWDFIRPMLPKPSTFGRPPTDRRRVLDAILYIVKGGISWRLLPSCFPPWKTVFHIFRQWQTTKLWGYLNDRLRAHIREAAGRKAQPTAAIIDSQSVKSAAHGGTVGYDAGKRIKGRKRHLLVDSMGLLLGVVVVGVFVVRWFQMCWRLTSFCVRLLLRFYARRRPLGLLLSRAQALWRSRGYALARLRPRRILLARS